jgi:aryl-alcohol dehydrogenase-like predicted oxidoreductase
MEEQKSQNPVLIATTFSNPFPCVTKFGAKAVVSAVQNSCTRMDTSGVELLQVQSTFLYPGGRRALANGLSQAVDKGYCNLTSNQFEFSLTNRKADKKGLIDACKELGVIPLVRNPLDDGLASGKYRATNPSGGRAGGEAKFSFEKLEKLQPLHSVQETVAERASTRVKREQRDLNDRYRARYGPAPKVNTDITTTQVAINYVIAKGAVPLVEVTDPNQADEVLGCLGWSLSEEEVDMLESAATLCGL